MAESHSTQGAFKFRLILLVGFISVVAYALVSSIDLDRPAADSVVSSDSLGGELPRVADAALDDVQRMSLPELGAPTEGEFVVRGSVVTTDGALLPDAKVELFRIGRVEAAAFFPDGLPPAGASSELMRATRTNDQGAFAMPLALDSQEGGRLYIRAAAHGYCTFSDWIPVDYEMHPIDLTLTLIPSCRVRVMVDGRMLEGGTTSVLLVEHSRLREEPRTQVLDDAGSAWFDNVAAGTVAAYSAGSSECSRTMASQVVNPSVDNTIVLQCVPNRIVEGIVVDANGAPVEGADILIFHNHSGSITDRTIGASRLMPKARSGQDGRFVLPGIKPDESFATLAAVGQVRSALLHVRVQDRELRLTVPKAFDVRVDFQVEEASELHGVGTLIPLTEDRWPQPIDVPIMDGVASFRVAPGQFLFGYVTSESSGYYRDILTIDSDAAIGPIILEPAVALRIRYKGDGVRLTELVDAVRVIPEITLQAVDRAEMFIAKLATPSAATGEFVCEDLAAGVYQVLGYGMDGEVFRSSVRLMPSRVTTLEVDLEKLYTLQVQIVEDGRPLSGALLSLAASDANLRPSQQEQSDEDGLATFRGVPVGDYRLRLVQHTTSGPSMVELRAIRVSAGDALIRRIDVVMK